MEPFEIMISESQERMLCVVEPERLDEVLGGLRALGGARHARSARSPTRGRLRVFDGDELVGDMPVAALVDDCPLYDLEPERAGRADLPAPPARIARRRRRRRDAARAARLAERRLASAGRSSSTTRSSARAPCAARRRPTPRCSQLAPDGGSGAIAVSIDGNGRRVACDPYTGAVEAVLECAREPRLRRRRAARPDQLPQLRQPREAAHRLAAHARGRGAGATPAWRSACRSSAATSRSTTRAARARSTRRRSSAWSASCPTPARRAGIGFAQRGRRDRAASGRSRRRSRARSWRSCAASWPTALPDGRPRAPAREALGALREAVRAGELATRPRHLRGRARRRAGRVLHRRRRWARGSTSPAARARHDDADAALFGEGPGGVVVAGPARGASRRSPGAIVLGEVGGDALRIAAASSSSPSATLRERCERRSRLPSRERPAVGRCRAGSLSESGHLVGSAPPKALIRP